MVARPPKKTPRASPSRPSLITLRIELMESEQAIWRLIRVDGRIRLDALHHVLQAAMGWSDGHLHEFHIHGLHYGVPDPEYDLDWEMRDEQTMQLNQLVMRGDEITYHYDFGDSWTHHVTVEDCQPIRDDDFGVGMAVVADGRGACPPEDSGGIEAYNAFVRQLDVAPYADETLATQLWAGVDFDPHRFDRHAANAAIARMLWNGWIKIGD